MNLNGDFEAITMIKYDQSYLIISLGDFDVYSSEFSREKEACILLDLLATLGETKSR